MNTLLLDELRIAQDLVLEVCGQLDEKTLRRQLHPELSPLGWHLGHCAYIESYWLQEIVQGDDRITAPLRELYTPPLTPKSRRGEKIPAPEILTRWVREQQLINHEKLVAPVVQDHPLMQDDYLLYFLIQHYSQHYENMLMVLTQLELAEDTGNYSVSDPLSPAEPARDTCSVEAGSYRVGGKAPIAYDNELPAHQASLKPFQIAKRPVVNAEYLGFIETGGYTRRELWSDEGWHWLQQEKAAAPQHWRRNAAGDWYGIGPGGAHDLHGGDAVHGISHYEASACANWAGGHLPDEHEWEVACQEQILQDHGCAWEWCGNSFHPYEGFRPFPYNEYSQSWFDNRHYTLRGGSLHTRSLLKRASFRNFYTADKRHIFAGLRLAF